MIIQSTPYGTAAEEPFAFTYSGDFTDERVDGIGDVTLNTSGTLTVTGGKATVQAYILGGGGGTAFENYNDDYRHFASGGGGGNQTVEVELAPGIYEIIIGTGGAASNSSGGKARTGGSTSAFGMTCTGGTGGNGAWPLYAGSGGTPNGNDGQVQQYAPRLVSLAGGSPNGGSIVSGAWRSGGDGLVRLTFS